MKRKKGTMSLSLSKKIIDECRKLRIGYLTVYGFGEPLLDKFFFDRVRYAKSAKIPRVTTNTNAMYLNKQARGMVFKSGLDEIYISFDAATAETYRQIRPGLNFKVVEDNILALVEEKRRRGINKPRVILSFVESGENTKEVSAYTQKWKGKVDGVSVSIIHNWTGEIDTDGLRLRGFRDPCRLLWTDMVISWDGKVPLCCNDYENRVILGDCNKESLDKIWGGSKLREIRDEHLKKNFSEIKICADCTYNFHYKSPWWVSR